MGAFDFAKGLFKAPTIDWKPVGNFFNSTGQKIGDAGKTAINYTTSHGEAIINQIHQDVKDYAGGIKDTVDNAINRGTGTISDISKNLALPLLVLGGIAGVGILLYASNNKKMVTYAK